MRDGFRILILSISWTVICGIPALILALVLNMHVDAVNDDTTGILYGDRVRFKRGVYRGIEGVVSGADGRRLVVRVETADPDLYMREIRQVEPSTLEVIE